MSTKELLGISLFVQVLMSVGVMAAIIWRKAYRIFPPLVYLLAVDAGTVSVTLALLYFRKALHLSLDSAYTMYFWVNWATTGFDLVLRVMTVYAIFAEAIRPMQGLHKVGKVIFRWVGLASILVALAMVAGPGVFSSLQGLATIFSHLQQGVSVLTLCLLVFVCFTVRPLGLTFRSHLFGVSLGLGIASTVELVQAAWQVSSAAHSVYSPVYLVSSVGFCFALAVWGVYFGAPEPKRKMILLPTTSPFFFWNRISEVLGDAPGQVAVAGFTPDMLAPAEIEMLTAATSGEAVPLSSEKVAPSRMEKPALSEFGTTRRPTVAL